MALKVWLPLNGDLENFGTTDFTYTTNIVGGYEAGKIGQALSLLNSKLVFNIPSLNGATKFSIAFWYKPRTNSNLTANWYNIIALTAKSADESVTAAWRCESSYGNSYAISHHNNVGSPIDGGHGSLATTRDQWYHICLTCDGITSTKAYVNGILKSTLTYQGGHLTGLIGIADETSKPDGLLNDVRIYDHALSAAEVKEISQGLVVHYKLDSFQGGYGNPNLLPASDTTFFNTTHSFEFEGWVKNFYTTTWVNEHLTVGQQYTLSYTVTCLSIPDTSIYSVSETRPSPILVHQGGGWSQVTTTNDGIKSTDLLPGQSRTYKCTFIFNTATETQNYYGFCGYTCLYRNADRTSTAYAKFRIDNLKLELGSDATSWIPNVNDEIIDVTHVQDSSGYDNNGTILNAAKISSDTPRYLYSMSLPNANSMINCGRGGMVTDSITVNFWCKYSSWANPVSCTEGGGWNMENNGGSITFPVYISSVGYVHSKNGTGAEQLPPANYANAWHMFTGTYNKAEKTVSLYVDGELKQQNIVSAGNNIAYHSSNCIWIGAEATSSNTTASNGMAGLFSDFRIYCTALLDNDIKMLYNTNMKIDNLNNIHTFNIEETNNNILAGIPLTKAYGNRGELFTNYNSNGEPEFTTNNTSAGTDFIPITPGIYEYDYTITTNAGNMFYIGFERFDKDKTSRSNAACVYIKSGTNEYTHQHFQGTVDLSTDGVNPCAYIALRVLNGWSGTTSGVTGQAIIHNISLRLKSDTNKAQLTKQGNLIIEEIKEDTKASFHKLGIVEASTFIEK